MWKNNRENHWPFNSAGARRLPSIKDLPALLLLAGLTISVLTGGCTEEPPPTLLGKDRELIDTLYLQEVQVLRPQLDSLCEAIFEEEVARSVDSMVAIRRQEEARLRERIKLNQ